MNKCLGCGVVLQNENPEALGYVSKEHSLCKRCFRLKHYNEYEQVAKTNDEYLKIINSIDDNSLVVYVTSILNLNITNLEKFKNVFLVVTKKDILPKSIKDEKIISYLKQNGIYAPFHYIPLHSAPAGKKYCRTNGTMSVTNKVSDTLVRLPLYFDITDEDLKTVIDKVLEFWSKR